MPDRRPDRPGYEMAIAPDRDRVHDVAWVEVKGEIFDLAKNVVPGFEAQEFAGACFDPKGGEILFVNIQTPGIAFAIWGPWEEGGL